MQEKGTEAQHGQPWFLQLPEIVSQGVTCVSCGSWLEQVDVAVGEEWESVANSHYRLFSVTEHHISKLGLT